MGTKITITYDPSKVQAPDTRPQAQIMDTFDPSTSYVNSAAYEGTRYDSNVKGKGYMPQKEPYASTSIPLPVPFAQFKMKVQGETANTGVQTLQIEVADYKEVMHYKQLGEDLASQGFAVEVDDGSASAGSGTTPSTPPTTGGQPEGNKDTE